MKSHKKQVVSTSFSKSWNRYDGFFRTLIVPKITAFCFASIYLGTRRYEHVRGGVINLEDN